MRKHVLSRDKGLCQVCLAAGKYRPATQVDHILPKACGGTEVEGNLQAIGRACHPAKTAGEAAAAKGGV